jgi:hypothetical protein
MLLYRHDGNDLCGLLDIEIEQKIINQFIINTK